MRSHEGEFRGRERGGRKKTGEIFTKAADADRTVSLLRKTPRCSRHHCSLNYKKGEALDIIESTSIRKIYVLSEKFITLFIDYVPTFKKVDSPLSQIDG